MGITGTQRTWGDIVEPVNVTVAAKGKWLVNVTGRREIFGKVYAGSLPWISYQVSNLDNSPYNYASSIGRPSVLHSAESSTGSTSGDDLALIGEYDGENLRCYIDNVLSATDTTPSGDIIYNTGDLRAKLSDVEGCEFAVWSAPIGAIARASYQNGVPAFMIRRDLLLFYDPGYVDSFDYVGQNAPTDNTISSAPHGYSELLENYL